MDDKEKEIIDTAETADASDMEESKTEELKTEELKTEEPVIKKEEDEYEKICYVCRRPESKAGSMITMPGGMNFCHECMQKAFDTVTNGGLDLSKLQNMPYMNMNMNLSDLTKLENMEIPKKNKIKKKSETEKKVEFTLKDIPAPDR